MGIDLRQDAHDKHLATVVSFDLYYDWMGLPYLSLV